MTLERMSHDSCYIRDPWGLCAGDTAEAGTGRDGLSRGSSRHKYPRTRSYLGNQSKMTFELFFEILIALHCSVGHQELAI